MPDGVMGYTLQGGGDIAKLVGPFSSVLKGVVRDPFILNWLDLLSFLLSGSPTPSDPCFMWDPTLKRFQTFCGHIVTQEEVASDSLLLPGLPADGTIAAEVAFMFNEWYKPASCLEFPRGGSQAIVQALVR